MKITIELDENLPDDEIRIHCRRMTEELKKIQGAFASGHTETKRLVLYQGRFGVLCGCFGYFVF